MFSGSSCLSCTAGVDQEREKYEVEQISAIVASQVRHHQPRQGTKVRPSGRLSSSIKRPVGYVLAETSARFTAR